MKTCLLEKSLCSLVTFLWLGWCAVAQAAVPPTINGIWPATPIPGSMTFVFGANFSLVPGENKVSFGGVVAPIAQPIDSTLLVFFTPSGGTGGQVCVSTPAGDTCLVPPAPVCSGDLCVTGIWPADLKAGGMALLFGSGFTFPMTVKVNGIAPVFTQVVSPDILFFMIPWSVTPPIVVQVCNKTGNCVCFPSGCFIVQ